MLVDGAPLAEVVQECPDVPGPALRAPATIDLAGAEIELVSLVARETRLRKALEPTSSDRERTAVAPSTTCSSTARPASAC